MNALIKLALRLEKKYSFGGDRPPGFGPGPIKAHTWWDQNKAPPMPIFKWDGKRPVYEIERDISAPNDSHRRYHRYFPTWDSVAGQNGRAVFPNRESAQHWINAKCNPLPPFPEDGEQDPALHFHHHRIVTLEPTDSPPAY